MIIIYNLNQYTLLGLRSRNTANLVNISKQSNANAVTTTATIASVTTANGSNTNTSSYNQRSFSDYFNTWIHSSSSSSSSGSSSLEVLTTTLLVCQEPSLFPGLQKTITTLQKMTPRDRIILGMYC